MTRVPSALTLIGGFGVAVAALSVATTAAVVLLLPQPPASRMSPAAAVAALRGETPGYAREIAAAPPAGDRALLAERAIAETLRRAPADVRAVWLDRPWPDPRPATRRIRIPAGTLPQRPRSFVLVGERDGSFRMIGPAETGMRQALATLPMPGFVASVRLRDGRWLSIRPVRPLLGGWQRTVLLALALSLVLLAPLAWLFARRLTRPFRVLAGALGAGADAVPQGPRELRDAAAAIATMRGRLADEAAERARILTAIAHDLRTPLTGLRLRLEAVAEPQRARMVTDVERMQAMVGEVLGVARDAAAPSARIEVRAAIVAVLADPGASDGSVRLAPGDAAWIDVPVSAFRRAIENLVRNAIDYAGGGRIEVGVANGEVSIAVIDSGPGIAPEDRERLLRPFERGDASRNRDTGGAGLGLSIVHDFAIRHRGSVALTQADGGGTAVILRLPAA